jgi:hypothetical protein
MVALGACTHGGSVPPAATVAAPAKPTSAAATAAKPAPPPPAVPKLEPPDGKWLVDDQGREYFVEPAPRIEQQYRWENDEKTRVRLPFGLVFDVVSYDDDVFMVKMYRPQDIRGVAGRQPPTPEARAAAARDFIYDTPDVDRLAFADYDGGLPRRGQWRNGFGVADMDGDGQLDIAHGPARKGNGRPTIFRGDGNGTWQPWKASFPALMLDYGDAAVADFDGDGHLDLALGIHLRGITVFRGDGAGGFTSWSQGLDLMGAVADRETPPYSSRTVRVGDWNGDGRPDLITLGEGPRFAASRDVTNPRPFQEGSRGLRIFLNQGDGSWKTVAEEGSRVYGSQLALADFDEDGRLDAANAADVGAYSALIAFGTADGGIRREVLPGVRPDATVGAVEAGDFDGDGHVDLAVGYLSHQLGVARSGVDLLLHQGDTWTRRPLWNVEDRRGVYALSAGDVDGDGHLDLAAATGQGEIEIFLGDGHGGFAHELAKELSVGDTECRGYSLRAVDLDRDGRAELISGFAGEGNDPMGARLCPSGGALRAWHSGK